MDTTVVTAEDLNELYATIWDEDIPHSTVEEYHTHHDHMKTLMHTVSNMYRFNHFTGEVQVSEPDMLEENLRDLHQKVANWHYPAPPSPEWRELNERLQRILFKIQELLDKGGYNNGNVTPETQE